MSSPFYCPNCGAFAWLAHYNQPMQAEVKLTRLAMPEGRIRLEGYDYDHSSRADDAEGDDYYTCKACNTDVRQDGTIIRPDDRTPERQLAHELIEAAAQLEHAAHLMTGLATRLLA